MKWDGADWLSAPSAIGRASEVTVLRVLSVTTSTGGNKFLSANMVLLIGGKLHVSTIGPASAVHFDGETFTPYILTMTASGETGTLSQAESFHIAGSGYSFACKDVRFEDQY